MHMYESARMSAQMHRFASAVKIHYCSRRPNKNQSHSARVRTVLFKPVTESSQQAGGPGQSVVALMESLKYPHQMLHMMLEHNLSTMLRAHQHAHSLTGPLGSAELSWDSLKRRITWLLLIIHIYSKFLSDLLFQNNHYGASTATRIRVI